VNTLANPSNRRGDGDIPRLAYDTKETAAALGVKPTTVWRLTKRGLLRPNRATRRPLYPISEIKRFLETR
jgi:hypothetical protein